MAVKKKTKKEPPMKSFKLSREYLPFLTFKVTKQTYYWSALLVIILILELWILSIQLDVISVTDSTLF
jgi:hypothetical protein